MTQNVSIQTLSVPVSVGDTITLYDETEMGDSAVLVEPTFIDTIEQYNPETGLLRFDESDVGRAEFMEMLDEAAGVKII